MPERTRLLAGQWIDVVLEARGIPVDAPLRITANGEDWTNRFSVAELVDLDRAGRKDWRRRLDLTVFPDTVVLRAASGTAIAQRRIEVILFPADSKPMNILLFVGDGTGWAYRAAGADGKTGITDRIYSQLQNLDQMPVTGSARTHSLRSLVPDSAFTASAGATEEVSGERFCVSTRRPVTARIPSGRLLFGLRFGTQRTKACASAQRFPHRLPHGSPPSRNFR